MNNPLVQPDPGLFIWTILTFLVLLSLLWKLAWKPLLKLLDSRKEAIQKSLEDAQKAKDDLDKARVEASEIIRQAHVESESIFARTRSEANKLGEELREKTRKDAEGITRDAEKRIQNEARQALLDIRKDTIDLSVTIASKLIERHVTREDNEKFIEETLRQIEASRQ
ncbi:MAG: synthase subunit [Acidobacteria bacterium]|jgi:F-type H+-transporting ATPase subunit b|nr:synthase subunit [Acidobacteriota bacterium]